MTDRSGQSANAGDAGLSRRAFLKCTGVVAGAASFAARKVLAAEPARPGRLPDVVQVRSDDVVGMRGVHEELLADLLHILLRRLTGKEGPEAWKTFLKPDDIVALKFNRSGALGLGTTDPLLRVLVQSLKQAGFEARQIVAVEVSPAIQRATGVTAPVGGWTEEAVDFGSGQDQLAAWLNQVTAIVNIPFLKTHNIAGMTCCLKNLSHAVVKHPAQYHANGCAPYIGDIVALPQIRKKLRLHLVNALRMVFEGGPEVDEDCVWEAGALLGGRDPVALDAVGFQELTRVRDQLRLPSLTEHGQPPAYLESAAQCGLGTLKLHEILLDKVKL